MGRRTLFLATTLLLVGREGAAQTGYLILRTERDTIAIERFTRTPAHLQVEALVKVQSALMRLDADVGSDGLVPRLVSRFWSATDSAGAAPRQSADFRISSDSIIVDISGGGRTATQRFGVKPGTIPQVNPSMALLELVLGRAIKAKLDQVPAFAVAGGQSYIISIRRLPPDSMVLDMAGGEVRVKVDAEGRILGGTIPAQQLVIERVSGEAALNLRIRPPDYSAPAGAPYDAIEVTVPTPMGHTLAGTLTLPKGAGPNAKVPAIVTITGSGLEDRDESLPIVEGYRPFRQVADSLGRRGIAVLRMDDRGYGQSGGNGATATSADFADDIRAGLAWLRTRPEIDGSRLGLVGHSEGGIIGPLVAATDPTLKGIVLMAGPSQTGRQILKFQLRNGLMGDTTMPKPRRDSLIATIPQRIDSMGANPWTKFFLDHDPLATIRKVKVPVLILQGGTDQQVTPDQAPELDRALRQSGNRDVTMKVFPNLNHLFVYDPNGFPGGYMTLTDRNVRPEVIGTLVDWLVTKLR